MQRDFAGAGLMGAMPEMNINFAAIRFSKTGSDIREGIQRKLGEYGKAIDGATAEIAAICKRRDLTVEEVLEAKTEEHIQSYSNKASTSLGGQRSNTLLRELEEDLGALRHLTDLIQGRRDAAERLERVSRNIHPAGTFELSYADLELFGL